MSSPAWGVESGYISVAAQQAVAVVASRRPEKLNALTVGMRRELVAVFPHGADHRLCAERAPAAAAGSLTRCGVADE